MSRRGISRPTLGGAAFESLQMIPARSRQKVYGEHPHGPGAPYFAHTTMASTVFEAVAQAKEFFETDFWKGPKPTPLSGSGGLQLAMSL